MSATGLTFNGFLSPLTYLREKKTNEKEAAAILQALRDNREKVWKSAAGILELKKAGSRKRSDY